MKLLKLYNQVQHYDWGTRDVIPSLIGAPVDGRPWAEMWMGTHSRAPSATAGGESLAELVALQPEAALGSSIRRAHGDRLPFLFKILSAERPLSIQAHPDSEQARAGYERENALGIALDAPHRNYKDAFPKPELVVALGEFWALKGFRRPQEICALFSRAGIETLGAELETLRGRGDLQRFYSALMGASKEAKKSLLDELSRGARHLDEPERAWVGDVLALYPDDLGAFAPLYLNILRLERGDCIFLNARELHSYLRGSGLELMASSDNVLRGGLTSKHVDVPELLATLSYQPTTPRLLRAVESDRLQTYAPPCSELKLHLLHLAGKPTRVSLEGPGIALALRGEVTLQGPDDFLSLASGESAFIPFVSSRALELGGDGELAIASCTPLP